MAAQGDALMLPSPHSEGPPAWAESLLRALLAPRNRDTVSGDLLEEYREVVLPARGHLRAGLWYLRQVSSFVTVKTLSRVFIEGFKEDDAMVEKSGGQSWTWFLGGGVALLVLLGVLARSNFGSPVPIGVPIAASLVLLTASMAESLRWRPDVRSLWRLAIACGLLVSVILVARLLVDTFDPVDPLERFLAQARDDYSEFDYPRRWVPAAAIAAIVMAGGLLAARRSGRIGLGILLAAASSAIGSTVYAGVAIAGSAFVPVLEPPIVLVPILVMFSTFLGTIGAVLGRALGSVERVSGS
jgi:hypothetical protein